MEATKFEILSAEIEDDALLLKIRAEKTMGRKEYFALKKEYSEFFPDVKEIRILEESGALIFFSETEEMDPEKGSTEPKKYVQHEEGGKFLEYDSIDERKRRHIEQLEKQRSMVKKEKKKQVKEKDPAIIYGSLIKEDAKPIASIEDENSNVCYEGVVYSYESKLTRKGYLMVSFSLVDQVDGISVKYFLNENLQKEYQDLKDGTTVKVNGIVSFDEYSKENFLRAKSVNLAKPKPKKVDGAQEKRVEFKIHSNMSQMSGVNGISDIIKTVDAWGHRGIVVMDEGAVQSYPEAMNLLEGKKLQEGFKVLYGVNAKVIDPSKPFVELAEDLPFETDYVVFDIETTGLSFVCDEIIEIGAFKLKKGEVVDKFISFVKPKQLISLKTIELTGINDDMVEDADPIEVVLPKFKEFCGDAILVAHNASFDVSFIRAFAGKLGFQFENPVLDTLALSRMFVTTLKRHSLDKVSKELNVVLTRHHRAEADVDAATGILLKIIEIMQSKGIRTFFALNEYAKENLPFSAYETRDMTLIIKKQDYLSKFYELISDSHIIRFFKDPLYDLRQIKGIREGLLIGAAGFQSELVDAYFSHADDETLKQILEFYDYVEVYPPSAVLSSIAINEFSLHNYLLKHYHEYVEKICVLCDELEKPVLAVSNAYYIDEEDRKVRTILLHSDQDLKHLKRRSASNHLRTTEEMFEEFRFLPREKAYEIIIKNPNRILDQIEQLRPIPLGTFPPFMDGAADDLKEMCYRTAHEMYGDELPEPVAKRLDRELKAIIGNGYAVMYMIASKIVRKSNSDGYLVGSRGSVGSSFAATTSGITEVNPLPPHYYCLEKPCHYSEFVDEKVYHDGFDLPIKACPVCGKNLHRDGHNIPFETFMGFKGEKEPDIDLNFAGVYQSQSHAYAGVLFGDDHVFKAGTISTIQGKTAFGFVKKFFEDEGKPINSHYANRFASTLEGIKRTTGQHAGGIMVVPKDKTIYDFSPVQYPSNDETKGTITTHFDYSTLSGIILKLDLLGHNAPTVIKLLEEYTGVSAFDIGFDDEATMKIFSGTESLGIKDKSYQEKSGALGIPEFGTIFVRGILEDTSPTTFFELSKICGVAHGTNVWNNNAQDLIRNKTCTLMEAICVRDEIMTHLIKCGLDSEVAFNITEKVRKGKGLTEEHEAVMRENQVPEWYIESCKKISYMFPLAHSVAYVMMSFRIAYYKVHYPLAFYAAFFSANTEHFDAEIILAGKEAVDEKLKEFQSFANKKEKSKEQVSFYVFELAREMLARGLNFKKCDLKKSSADVFLIDENALLMPLTVVPRFGAKAAQNIVEYREKNEIYSVDDLRKIDGVSRVAIENFRALGMLDEYPESSQFTLDMFF